MFKQWILLCAFWGILCAVHAAPDATIAAANIVSGPICTESGVDCFVDSLLELQSNEGFVERRLQSLSFPGMNETQTGGAVPPDTNGAVGPDHYMQNVNFLVSVFRKGDGQRLAIFNTNRLWAGQPNPCATNNDGDGIVLYDRQADRWVVTQFVALPQPTVPGATYGQCLAVSTSPNPLGTYNTYFIQVRGVRLQLFKQKKCSHS